MKPHAFLPSDKASALDVKQAHWMEFLVVIAFCAPGSLLCSVCLHTAASSKQVVIIRKLERIMDLPAFGRTPGPEKFKLSTRRAAAHKNYSVGSHIRHSQFSRPRLSYVCGGFSAWGCSASC